MIKVVRFVHTKVVCLISYTNPHSELLFFIGIVNSWYIGK